MVDKRIKKSSCCSGFTLIGSRFTASDLEIMSDLNQIMNFSENFESNCKIMNTNFGFLPQKRKRLVKVYEMYTDDPELDVVQGLVSLIKKKNQKGQGIKHKHIDENSKNTDISELTDSCSMPPHSKCSCKENGYIDSEIVPEKNILVNRV